MGLYLLNLAINFNISDDSCGIYKTNTKSREILNITLLGTLLLFNDFSPDAIISGNPTFKTSGSSPLFPDFPTYTEPAFLR